MIAPTGGYANRMHIRPLLHGAVVDGASKMHHRVFEVYLDWLIDVADAFIYIYQTCANQSCNIL